MNEFTHYERCGRKDPDNCSACALLTADVRGPNYSGWPLSFMNNRVGIPKRYYLALIAETERTDNPAYVANLKQQLKEHGYDLEIIRSYVSSEKWEST